MQISCIKKAEDPIPRKLRVAAYARVSSGKDAMLHSLSAQIAFYSGLIQRNPEWEYAGVYADEAITGTKASRPEFQRLLRDCKAGKIDLILTKSISRLSRNTVDCLQYVRLLQELRIPVIFEAEGINTLNMQNEFLLAVMGANSQAESEATSSRVKWGVRNAFREGKVRYYYQYWLGYRKGKDGTPEIIPEEAETVKQIYADYLSGKSLRSIADSLESRGILPRAGQAKWTTTYIRGILQNERYTGDALLQKTYTTDPITKKQKKNRGELPQYLVKNCHPAIISHELFDLVQKEISRRSVATGNSDADSARPKPAYSGKYALSELLVCGECNTLYRRCTWKGNKGTRIVWRCRSRLDHGKKYCKHSPTLDEAAIHQALVNAINQQLVRPEYLLAPFEKIPFHLSDFPVSAKSWPELYSNLLKRQSMLDTEIKNANEGKEAWVKMKINHITDTDMVTKLYQASKAGVKIDIVIRGNCSLVPGIAKLSDNIHCVGIIDRYLEHSRILIFANGGKPRYFIGSADWMPRNLINRIEVLTPVYDEDMQADLLRTISYGMRDTMNGRVVDGKGGKEFVEGEPFRSQEELYKAYK